MNFEFPWIEIIVEEEEKELVIPFYPQEFEDDNKDIEEWGLL